MNPPRHYEPHSHSGQSQFKSSISVNDCDLSRLEGFPWPFGMDQLEYIPLQPEPRPRELVTVPTIDDFSDEIDCGSNHPLSSTINHNHHNIISNNNNNNNNNKKRKLTNRRPGERSYSNKRMMLNSDKCILEVRRIPPSLNTMENLVSHFSKFGTIVNLQLCPNGDSEAALVTFDNPNEANKAYRSTEAVLNNRFIRVFWHHKDQPKQQQQQHEQNLISGNFGSGSLQKSDDYCNAHDMRKLSNHSILNDNQARLSRLSVKERLGNRLGDHRKVIKRSESVLNDAPNLPKSKQIHVSAITRTVPSDVVCSENYTPNKSENDLNKDKLYQNMELQKKRHVMLHKVLELQKKRQDILLSYMKQQMLLVEKLKKAKSEKEKNEIKATIDTLTEQINALKEEISKENQSIQTESAKLTTNDKKNELEVKKELLDAELDFYNKLHKGETSAELGKKLHELKLRAKQLGVTNSKSPRFMKRFATMTGALRGRKLRQTHLLHNTSYDKYRKVDRRTRKILIQDVNEEDNIDMLSHISQYAEVEKIVSSPHGLIVTFKTRHDAEVGIKQISTAKYKENQGLKCSWFEENKAENTEIEKLDYADDVSKVEEKIDLVEDDKKSTDDSKNGDIIFDTADLFDDDEEDSGDESRAWRR